MIRRDPYVWIDPWDEFERFEDYLEREEEEHNNAMRRAYRAMADENATLRTRYEALISTVSKGAAFAQNPIFVVPK